MIVGFRILISMLSCFTDNRFPKDFMHAQEKWSITNISPQPPLDICDLVASFSIIPAPGKFSHQLTAILFCTHLIPHKQAQWAVNNTYITRCTSTFLFFQLLQILFVNYIASQFDSHVSSQFLSHAPQLDSGYRELAIY